MKRLVKLITIILTIAYVLLIPLNSLAKEGGTISANTTTSLLSKWQGYGIVDKSISNSDLNKAIEKIDFISFINGIMKPTRKVETGFIDLPKDSWYEQEIAKAVAAGYIDKGNKTKFNPFSDITRLEAALMVKRVFGLELNDKRVLTKIKDAEALDSNQLEGFAAVIEKGYLTQVEEGRYVPYGVLKLSDALEILDICVGEVVSKSGTISDNVLGNMLVNTGSVTLKSMNVTGDLTIGEGVGNGDVRLDGVSINGKLIIRGGGPNTVTLTNTRIDDILVIDKSEGNVHVRTYGTTTINNTLIKSGCYLDESGLTTGKGFTDITLNKSTVENQRVDLNGDYNKLTVDESNLDVKLSGKAEGVDISKGATSNFTLDSGSVTVFNTKASQNLIDIIGGTITTLNIDTGAIGNKLTISGKTTVSNINIRENSNIELQKGTVEQLTLESNSTGSKLNISSGANLKNLTANASATISGNGSITNAYIYVPNVSMNIKPSGEYKRTGTETGSGSNDTNSSLPKITISNVYNRTIQLGSNDQKLNARASNEAEIFYSSADSSIVTVGEKGELTGVSAGTTEVYISAIKHGYAPAIATVKITVISKNKSSSGTLEISPDSGKAGSIVDNFAVRFTPGENIVNGRIVINLPVGFSATENDRISINSGAEVALTKSQIINEYTLSFSNISLAEGENIEVRLKNVEIPSGQQFVFSAVADSDGIGPKLPAGEVSCTFTADSLKELKGNGVNYSTPEYGSVKGTTKIASLSFVNISGATKWMISDTTEIPVYDQVLSGTDYVAGQDIQAVPNQQIMLAAVDSNNRVKAYAIIVIKAENIRPDDATALDPSSISVKPGIQAGTVMIDIPTSVTVDGATTWMYKVQNTPSTAILVDSVFDGTESYSADKDIKVSDYQYIVIAAVDNATSKKVKAYVSLPVAGKVSVEADRLVNGINYKGPGTGSVPGAIMIDSLNSGSFDISSWQYVVLGKAAVIPAKGALAETYRKYVENKEFVVYAEKDNIFAAAGQHVLLVGVSVDGKIIAYADITVDSGVVRREDAPAIPATNVVGPVMGAKAGTISVTTNFSTPVAGATKYKYKFQNDQPVAPQINIKADGFSDLETSISATGKYLVLVAVDNSGLIKAWMYKEVDPGVIRPADAYLLKVTNGEYTKPVPGTTIGAISLSINQTQIETNIGKQVSQWWYKLSDKDFDNPYTGSNITGDMIAYTPGQDIGNVSEDQYLLIIGTDGSGTITYLKERIQYDQIKQGDAKVLKSSAEDSVNFNYSVPEPGDKSGQTKITTLKPVSGAYAWEYKTSDTPVTAPGSNTSAVTLGTSQYSPNQSITVDKQYLVLYAVDNNNSKRIKAYANIPIGEAQKRPMDLVEGHNYRITTGSTKGTVAISFLSFADLGATAPYTGWSWKYAVVDTKYIPGRGTEASKIPGITDIVSTPTNITAKEGQYLLLIAAENGLVKGFANISVSSVINPGNAELITPDCYTLTKGSVEGTTRFAALNMGISGQTKWAYAIKEGSSTTTPILKDVVFGTIGAKALDQTKDIPINYGQTILLLAIDNAGKVKGYVYIPVTEDQIQAPFAINLSLEAYKGIYSGPSKGSKAGSTKIALKSDTGNIPLDAGGVIIWKYKKGTSLETPHLNDDAGDGSGYLGYLSTKDIENAKVGEQLLIVAVSQNPDGSERVKAYLKFTLISDWISSAEMKELTPEYYGTPSPGSEPGTTKFANLELFEFKGCQWKVKVSDTDIKIYEDTIFTGTIYKEGDNIAVKQNQYVVLAAVDTSGKVKGYKNILIDKPEYLNAPGLKSGDNYAAPKWGSQEGTTSVYVSPKGLVGNIVFVVKVTNSIENIVAESTISYTSPAAIDINYSTYKAYTTNSDISVKAGQYILLAAVDADTKKVVAYRNIPVVEANIMPEGADTLDININYLPLQPGAAAGTTKIPLKGFDGVNANTWLVKVVTAPITSVALDSVDNDAKVYVSNADISVKPGDYVILYAASKVGTDPYKIKAFACIPVNSDDIRGAAPELVISAAPIPGTVLNTTSVVTTGVTLPSGATMIRYLVGNSSAGTILKDSDMSRLPEYKPSGSNIPANEGQYLVFVATDDSGYVKAVSKEIKLTAEMIKNVVLTLGGSVFPAVSEGQIATGGQTITLTLDSAEWADDAITTNKSVLLSSFVAATENDKWATAMGKVTMIDKSADSRTITIKLSESTYDITANQKITVTIPAKLIKGAVKPVTAKETINVSVVSGLGVTLMLDKTSVTSFSQNDIKAGTVKIIITLTGGGKFTSDVDSSTEKKNAILNGLKATYNTTEWSDVLSKATLTLNSESKLTIELKDETYDPKGNEVISVTIPAKDSSGNYIIDGAVNNAEYSGKITIYSNISAALSGTLVSPPVTEADIVAGSETLVITLTNGKWASDIASNATVSKALFDGLTVSPTVSTNDTNSWKNKVIANLKTANIKVNSDTEIVITLPAATGYAISADQSIVVNIPSVCIAGGIKDKLIAPQSIIITNIAPAVPAVVKNVSVTGSAIEYKKDDKILISVEFDTAIDVTGTPKITLNTGKDALYKGKAADNTLTFEYTVVSGDNTTKLDYKTTSSLVLNNGTINNGETPAKLTLPSPGAKGSISDPLKTPIVVDTVAPSFTNTGAPKQTATKAETTADITFTINEDGKVYYVVIENGSSISTPTVQQIADWNTTTPAPASVVAKGKVDAIANVAGTMTITGLAPNKKYNVYMLTEDNLQNRATAVKTLSGVQTIDVTPPTVEIVSVVPSDYSVSLVVKSNETGNIFVVAKLHGSTAPTKTELTGSKFKAVVDSDNVNKEITINVTGLTVSTDYDIYVAGNDKASTPNISDPKVDSATTKSLDLTKVDVDLANNKLLNTNALMQYSINGGVWKDCTAATTNVTFDLVDDPDTIKVQIKEKSNPTNPIQTIILYRGDDASISRSMIDFDIAAGTITNKTDINLEFRIDQNVWKQLKAKTTVSGVNFVPGTLYLRLAVTSPSTAGSRDAKLPSKQKGVDGFVEGYAPALTADDTNNIIVGLSDVHEYKIDGGAWTSVSKIPTFSGTKTVLVRFKATASKLASEATELKFTANTFTATAKPATTTGTTTTKATVTIVLDENTNLVNYSLSAQQLSEWFQITSESGDTHTWGDATGKFNSTGKELIITFNAIGDIKVGDVIKFTPVASAAIQNANYTTCKLAGSFHTTPKVVSIMAENTNNDSVFSNGERLVIKFDQAVKEGVNISNTNIANFLILTDESGATSKKWSKSGSANLMFDWSTDKTTLFITFNVANDTELTVGDKIRISADWKLTDEENTTDACTSTKYIGGSFTTP